MLGPVILSLKEIQESPPEKVSSILLNPLLQLNHQDDLGRSLFYLLCKHGKVEYLSILLQRCLDTNKLDPFRTNNTGLTPVESACLNGQLKVLQLLAKENGKMFWFWKKETELVSAVWTENFEEFKRLLWMKKNRKNQKVDLVIGSGNQNKSDIDVKREKENEKVQNGSKGLIQSENEEESEYEYDCNVRFVSQTTLFYVLCSCGLTKYLEEILKRPDLRPNDFDSKIRTPFSTATQNGHTEAVRLLMLNPKVDVNMPDKEGITPLSIACHNCHEEVVNLLLQDPRVDLNIVDTSKSNAFQISCETGDEGILELFLNCPRLKIQNDFGYISRAAKKGKDRLIRVLLRDPRFSSTEVVAEGVDDAISISIREGHPKAFLELMREEKINVESLTLYRYLKLFMHSKKQESIEALLSLHLSLTQLLELKETIFLNLRYAGLSPVVGELVDNFLIDVPRERQRYRIKFGTALRDACELYTLICLVHRGYLEVDQNTVKGALVHTFYQLMRSIPSEIEMRICFRYFFLKNELFTNDLLQESFLDIKAKFAKSIVK